MKLAKLFVSKVWDQQQEAQMEAVIFGISQDLIRRPAYSQ